MQIFIKYFLFLSIPIGAINAVMIKHRVSSDKELDSNAQSELNKFTAGVFFSLTIPFTLLGILQLCGGHEHCFFMFSTNFSDTTIVLSWIVLFASWSLILWWVWFRSGASILLKYRTGLRLPSFANSSTVKLLVTLCVFGAILALVIGSISGLDNKLSKIIEKSTTALLTQ